MRARRLAHLAAVVLAGGVMVDLPAHLELLRGLGLCLRLLEGLQQRKSHAGLSDMPGHAV